jgi:superfamily II DNA helicase RecQ
VALSLLEEAGLVHRGPDVPRTATIRIQNAPSAASQDPSAAAFSAFTQAAHLRPGQPLDLDLLAVARQAQLPLASIEQSVLEWADSGWLTYRASGRDMLLELPPAPSDAAQRVETLIERQATIQVQRVDEMVGYAQARRCRHGHLNAYLGGQTIERCATCDNCIQIPPRADPGLPAEREQLQTILQCVADAQWSWGRVTLLRILRGDAGSRRNSHPLRPEARAQAQFGLLAFRSRAAVEKLLDRLLGSGFLRERRLDHGGTVLELTKQGQAAIKQPRALDDLVGPPVSRPRATSSRPKRAKKQSQPEGKPKPDPALLEKLLAWRLAVAKEQKLPPFFILHQSHLETIAAYQPMTREALGRIKGVGPKRLAQYGEALLEIIGAHLDPGAQTRADT